MPNFAEECFARGGDHAAIVGEFHVAVLAQRIGERDAEPPGDVVVAHARLAHRVVDTDRAQARRRNRGDRRNALDHRGDMAPASRK